MMAKVVKLEWLNSHLITSLRWEEDGGNIAAKPIFTPDQNRRKETMKKHVGLWLDRKKAVIVSLANNVEARAIITSDMDHYVLYSKVVPGDGSPENPRDRRYWNHLDEYYDKIMAHLRDAGAIQIIGPDDARFELRKHLESEGLAEHIVSMEEAGTLTDVQIATKIRQRFPIRSQFDIF